MSDYYGAQLRRQLAGLREQLAEARATNQRLNYRAQQAESRLATVQRAVNDWRLTERGTYVPLRSLNEIAKVMGRGDQGDRWELHYQRVEAAEARVAELESARGAGSTVACTVCAGQGATAYPHLGVALCQACVDCGCDRDPCERAAAGKRTP